ncbi:MAG: MipA/OmpV family protein [Pseudorhodobacter sp.]|nr:MipA/OmpV family protein [Pseudorhodobacter sp.]
MKKSLLAVAGLVMLPATAFASGPEMGLSEPEVMAPAPAPAAAPGLIFTLRAGLGAGPEYFGSDTLKAGPDFAFSLNYLRLPGSMALGNADPSAVAYGFAPRGSFRIVQKRSADDYAELTGLEDVDLSVEIGMGLGYTAENFEAFGDLRYGAIGHHSWVGELGANLIMRPNDKLTLKVGPRVLAADSGYANTYFGVTADESTASGGDLAAYDAKGGAMSVGMELGMTYALTEDWGIDGAVRWDQYVGGAKDSPIVAQGSDTQTTLRIGLTRRFTLNF